MVPSNESPDVAVITSPSLAEEGEGSSATVTRKRIRIDLDSDDEEDENPAGKEGKKDVEDLVCNISLMPLRRTNLRYPTNVKKHCVEFPCCSLKVHGTCLAIHYLEEGQNV